MTMKLFIHISLFSMSCCLSLTSTAQNELEILPGGLLVNHQDHQSISNPLEGQFVFDRTTHSYWLFDDQTWKEHKGGLNIFYSNLTNGNSIIGDNAANVNYPHIGFRSSIFGVTAGFHSLSADNNTHIGSFSGMNNQYGHTNTFVGTASGLELAEGHKNIAVGHRSGYRLAGTTNNILIGNKAGFEMSIGGYNTAIGYEALQENTKHAGNIAIGYQALQLNGSMMPANPSALPNLNLAIGHRAASSNVTASELTVIGTHAHEHGIDANQTTTFGYASARNAAHGRVIAFGSQAGEDSNSPVDNVFIGFQAGQKSELSQYNTIVGSYAGFFTQNGSGNTFIGNSVGALNDGHNNVYIGSVSGGNSSGSQNVFIGFHVGLSSTASQELQIDNSDTDFPLIHGDFSTNHESVTLHAKLSITDILQLRPLAVSPSNPVKGDIYMHDSNGQAMLRYYDGSQWINL